MGLLKVTLPLLGLAHLALFYKGFFEPAGALEVLSIEHAGPLSTSTVYLTHMLAGAFLSFGVLNLLSYVMGSMARFKVGIANLIFHAVPVLDANFNTPGATTAQLQLPLVGAAGVLALGLLIHAFEPGLFTADKSKRPKRT